MTNQHIFSQQNDLPKVKELAVTYRNVTGLPLLLVDPHGNTLWNRGDCGLCAKLMGRARKTSSCRSHFRRAMEESLRWREPYISMCPVGLATFAVPIVKANKLAAGLISGFSIFPQMKSDMRQEVRGNLRKLGIKSLRGPKTRLRFRVISSETLRDNAELLFGLTGKHDVNDPQAVSESREKRIQQYTIANYIEEARKENKDLVTSLVGMQNEIIEKVVLGDVNGSREIINQFLGVIFLESGMSFEVLKVRLLELIVIISRAAIMKGISADGLLGPRYSLLTEVNAADGFDELFWKVTKVLENFTRTVSEEMRKKKWAHMTRMKDYIGRNFTSDISAAQVASSAGLSVSRALHLFKKETGLPLSSYIVRERIRYAKYLLKNTDKSVAEVASDCAFFDQSHFTRAFRALEKTTPLKFRRASETQTA